MDYSRISADCHLDLCWLPPDLFVTQASRALRDRMPHVVDGPDGPVWKAANGAILGLVNGVGPTGQKYVKGSYPHVDEMAATGLYEDGKKGIRRVSDPNLRIKDMERDGVDAEVIYGILGVSSRLNDRDAANETMRIYNDWLHDFCSHYPDRHIGLACLPAGDIPAAVEEIHRVAKLGFRGIELSCSYDMMPMWHSDWEPLWEAVNDVALPLHFHGFPSVPTEVFQGQTGRARTAANFWVVSYFQLDIGTIIAGLICGAILERYPNIRVAFGESGIGWIPYLLDRMDHEWEGRFRSLPDTGLKMRPSDYWRRQCKATFQYDGIGVKLIEHMGAETLMWGSDYPHGDGVWPDSDGVIAKQFKDVSVADTRRITCDNAMEFYRLNG